MAKRDDIPKTDPDEIEALIQRLKQSKLERVLAGNGREKSKKGPLALASERRAA